MEDPLPRGVEARPLPVHPDARGSVTEMFRAGWSGAPALLQWNFVRSEAAVARGVHVHPWHDDWFVLLAGRATAGLKDLRRGSPTEGLAVTVDLRGERPRALRIPRGVAHGFCFVEPSLHAYGMTRAWTPDGSLRCHWRDPELGIRWPLAEAAVSDLDAAAPGLRVMREQLEPHQPFELL